MVKDEERPKLSRLEVLGAWLNLWTPPRDAHVPPVPWRKVGMWAAAVVVVLGTGLAIAIPRIDASKVRNDERKAAARAERAEARRARIEREQQPRTGAVPAGESRTAALATIGTAIGEDARERFHRRARAATCDPAPGEDEGAGRVAYDCISAVRDIEGAGEQEGARGVLGIPFRAVVDWDRGRYAFCKVNPPPGEQIIPDPREVVELPRACRSS